MDFSIIVLFGPQGLGTRLNISKNCKALTIYIYIYIYIVGGRCAMQEDKGKKERGFHFYIYRIELGPTERDRWKCHALNHFSLLFSVVKCKISAETKTNILK
jgi:hypothetical protein